MVVNRRDDMKSFEFMDVDVSSSGNSIKLIIIYRSPPSKKNKFNIRTLTFLFNLLVSWDTMH